MPVWLELLLAFGASAIGGSVTLFAYHSTSKRREGEAAAKAAEVERQTTAQWAKINSLDTDIKTSQTDIAVLEDRINRIPSEGAIRDLLDRMEVRLEARLNAFATTIASQIASIEGGHR